MGSASSIMSASPSLGNGTPQAEIPTGSSTPDAAQAREAGPSALSQSSTGTGRTGPDLAALKARALQSARARESGRSTPVLASASSGPTAPSPNGQVQKEEGEVSDEDEPSYPPTRPIPWSAKGKAKAQPSNGIEGLQPAATDISPEDAGRYMDIIRSLLQEGFHPDTLIKRGATAKYVTAVCEDIVSGTHTRKQALLQASAYSNASGASTPGRGSDKKRARSSSSEVEIVVTSSRELPRRDSLSSEGSAENELLEDEPPLLRRNSQVKLKPLEQWKPGPSTSKPATPTLPPRVAPVETYKPPSVLPRPQPVPSSSRLPVRPVSVLPPSAHNLPIAPPFPPTLPLPAPSLPSRPVPTSTYVPPPVSIREPPTGPKAARQPRRDNKRRKFKDEIVAEDQPILLNYDEESPAPEPVKPPPRPREVAHPSPPPPRAELTLDPRARTRPHVSPQPAHPVPLAALTPIPSTLPPATAPPTPTEDAEASNAILDIRRKALESLLKRRTTRDVPPSSGSRLLTPSEGVTPIATPVTEKAIDQEVLAMQKETETQETTPPADDDDEEVPMDVEEPEEGEIIIVRSPTPPPEPLPAPVAAPQPSRRGIKRPTAEDFDSKPVAVAASRVRRKPWCAPQHRSKLLINLDDDSDSSDEEDPISRLPTPMGIDLVKEKEEQIRLLKEKIAARMKEKIMAKIKLKDEKKARETSVDDASVPDAVADVVAQAVKAVPDDKLEGKLEEIEDKMDLDPVETTDSAQSAHGDAPAEDPTESSSSHTFTTYAPLMRRYPQLSTSTHASISYAKFEHKQAKAETQPSIFGSVDKSLLSSIILTNRTSANPHLVICRAEAGGGVCADPTCEDLHLDKGDPTQEDWEEYIVQSLVAADVAAVDKKKIRNAVKVVLGAGKARGNAESKVMTGSGRNLLASQEALEDVVAKIGMLLEDKSSA